MAYDWRTDRSLQSDRPTTSVPYYTIYGRVLYCVVLHCIVWCCIVYKVYALDACVYVLCRLSGKRGHLRAHVKDFLIQLKVWGIIDRCMHTEREREREADYLSID
jgi:hypothetical protein